MGRLLGRYWGFFAFLAAAACWVGLILGKVSTAIVALVLILSVGAVIYFLFQAPTMWCSRCPDDHAHRSGKVRLTP
jgi:hypothetical protein